MDVDDLEAKWNRRYSETQTSVEDQPQAAEVLRQNQHLLPADGQALDLACGLGGNALLLAASGLQTWAWDLSSVALTKLQAYAQTRHLTVHTEVRDVLTEPPPADAFDVLVVSRFLERSLAPALIESLRHGGLLFYQTFTRVRTHSGGPSNPAYLLDDGELLHLFKSLHVRVYREENQLGDTRRGFRNAAMLVAEKP